MRRHLHSLLFAWALIAAPLIAGNDLTNMTPATLDILTNVEVIAVNQDPLGIQGTPISESTTLEVWSKKLTGDDTYAVILFNRTEAEAPITVTWSEIGLTASSALVRDLWAKADVGVVDTEYTATVVVTNVAPTATLTGPATVAEGGTATVAFTAISDPSSDDTALGFRYSYDFDDDGTFDLGDGTYTGSVPAASAAVPAALLADGPALRVVRGRVLDKDGGFTDATTTISVTKGEDS